MREIFKNKKINWIFYKKLQNNNKYIKKNKVLINPKIICIFFKNSETLKKNIDDFKKLNSEIV